jgi:hypothetical protein
VGGRVEGSEVNCAVTAEAASCGVAGEAVVGAGLAGGSALEKVAGLAAAAVGQRNTRGTAYRATRGNSHPALKIPSLEEASS